MTFDIDVGFRTRPQGLDDFLRSQSYRRSSGTGRETEDSDYEHLEGWPCLYYTADFVQSPEEFDWESQVPGGIVAHLNINFPMSVPMDKDRKPIAGKIPFDDEAKRLATLLINRFNAAAYDPASEDFYETGDSLE